MDHVHLGRAGLRVGRLALGTMNFGPQTEEAEAFRILDHALDAGINLIDTADVYGWVRGEGVTEQIIGRWFAQGGGRRDRSVIATKLYGSMGDGPNDTFLSALKIRRSCDESLRRLQTDHIDLYQMHHVDRGTPWDEIWEAMEVLRTQGKIVYVGSSNFAGWHIATAQAAAHARNSTGLVSEQSIYNLLTRAVELEVLPACEQYGIGVVPWSPLHGGLLGGVLKQQEEGRRRTEGRAAEALERHRAAIQQWEDLCDELGEAPANVAIAWLLSRPAVTAPIVGPRTVEQLEALLRAPEIRLDDTVLARLDEIFPGHRTAPEDYAW